MLASSSSSFVHVAWWWIMIRRFKRLYGPLFVPAGRGRSDTLIPNCQCLSRWGSPRLHNHIIVSLRLQGLLNWVFLQSGCLALSATGDWTSLDLVDGSIFFLWIGGDRVCFEDDDLSCYVNLMGYCSFEGSTAWLGPATTWKVDTNFTSPITS